MSVALPAYGHETDQFTLPAGREFADIGDELTKTAYTAVEKGVNRINARIKGEVEGKRSPADLQTPDAIAASVNSEFPAALFLINDYDKRVLAPQAKAEYPGRIVGYKPSASVRKYVNVPLYPFNAWECATIRAYGVTFGTDKLGHFTDMGMHYFRAYRKALKDGANEDQARAKAIYLGTDEFIFAESGLLGWSTAGAYSNADLVANFMGMCFYRNLTEPVMLKGQVRPPMLERDGEYWKISPRVREDSAFFSLFVSEHFDEALNPSNYIPAMRKKIRRAIEEHAGDVVARYVDPNGNQRGQAYFIDKVRELSTYWGVEYGHKGGRTDLMTIADVCFGNLPQDAPIDARDRVGRTPLHIAAERGDLEAIRRILDRGGNVHVPVRSKEERSTEWGNTPLHLAARDGQLEAARLLIERGAEVNARNHRGVTPLHRAIAHPQVAVLLLERGAELNGTDGQGRTPLHWAAADPHGHALATLIAARANLAWTDSNGETPLHRAAAAQNAYAMHQLIVAGADVNAVDRMRFTPLHLAARSDDPLVASVLVRNGAAVDARDSFGCTPLLSATHSRNDEVIALLLGAGATPDIPNDFGMTPLQLAERTGRRELVSMLRSAATDLAAIQTLPPRAAQSP